MATLLEGVESISLWCSLVVLLPSVVLAVIARTGRLWLVAGTIIGTATMMWARAGRLWDWATEGPVRWLIGLAIVGTAVLVFRARHPVGPASVAAGVASGAIAGWLWQPCVGEHLATVLSQAETDRVASLVGMHAYVIGLSIPAIVLAALPHAWPRSAAVLGHRRARAAGLVVALAYGVAVAVGWYDDLVSELFRLSSR